MPKLNPDVQEIVGLWLKDHGYGGLFDQDDCGCTLEELASCGDMRMECEAGYKRLCKPEDCGDRNEDSGCTLECDGYKEGNWAIMRTKEGR